MVEISFAQSPPPERLAATGQSTCGGICSFSWRDCSRAPEINCGHRSSRSDAAEMDPLVTALLTSISHDLRTPLASILGCATSLSSCGGLLDNTTKRELIRTIQDEAEILNRFIGNLLNMTRLQAGALQLRTSPLELSDAIGSALRRSAKVLAAHRVEVRLQPDLTMLDLDAVLFEQVLFNLLDNAAKYTPPGSLIMIAAWRDDDVVRLQVLDEGPGIPPGDLDRVFQKFFRGDGTVQRCTGTGLGLAICLGFIDAMHGTISAANRSDRQGAVFTLTLPVPTSIDFYWSSVPSDPSPGPNEGDTREPVLIIPVPTEDEKEETPKRAIGARTGSATTMRPNDRVNDHLGETRGDRSRPLIVEEYRRKICRSRERSFEPIR